MTIGRRSRNQTERFRRVVYDRDGGVCVSSGFMRPCFGGLTVQHRVGRGMGGSAQYDARPAYLLCMCLGHNVLETENATAREAYRARGWSVSRWVVELWRIEDVPVCYFDGWCLLFDGGREIIGVDVAEEMMGAIYGKVEGGKSF